MKLFGTDGIRGEFGKPPINHNELLKHSSVYKNFYYKQITKD